MKALVSIHDVMPHTLPRVHDMLDVLDHLAPEHIPLLVVPGHDWQPYQIEQLRELVNRGFVLAGHGWHHTTREIRGLYHRLHSTFISRRAAEHLCLDENEISTLMGDCFLWFGAQGLPSPDLYVPPAWAMGNISRQSLGDTPFRYFETTAGFYDSQCGRAITLPLAGFEADNLFRVCSLSGWNVLNRAIATPGRPLRVALHPNDRQLGLKDSLHKTLKAVTVAIDYRSLF